MKYKSNNTGIKKVVEMDDKDDLNERKRQEMAERLKRGGTSVEELDMDMLENLGRGRR